VSSSFKPVKKTESSDAVASKTSTFDVIILGAGASGLMCARTAARRGKSVVVLDHGPKAARKLLVSGGGRCNITNLYADVSRYQSENPDFTRSALARFKPRDILSLLDEHHVAYEERQDGQIFLKGSASLIANALMDDCDRAGVTLIFNAPIKNVKHTDGSFKIASKMETFLGKSLVVATGGKSWNSLGASGFGYELGRRFGHRITELRPGLVPFVLKEKSLFRGLTGVSFRARVITRLRTFTGDVLVTHRGLSGPAVLQASSFWREGEAISIGFLPEEDAGAWLDSHRVTRKELKNLLAERLPRRLAIRLAEYCGGSAPMNSMSDKQLARIAETLGSFDIHPSDTEGFGHAEVTVGGVDTKQVSSKSMESSIQEGLFFIGEVLDVTGELGGFNLHWAWVSALAAGEYL